jgi:hypothetical protein
MQKWFYYVEQQENTIIHWWFISINSISRGKHVWKQFDLFNRSNDKIYGEFTGTIQQSIKQLHDIMSAITVDLKVPGIMLKISPSVKIFAISSRIA